MRAQTTPEAKETLQAQQQHLIAGHRAAQMFPRGTKELPLPKGMQRVAVPTGDVFHFNPAKLTRRQVLSASLRERENEILGLGPHNKRDVAARVAKGEQPIVVTERTPHGVEVRAAVGTHHTAPRLMQNFLASKAPGGTVAVEHLHGVLHGRTKRGLL
jgi:hypothetical protein